MLPVLSPFGNKIRLLRISWGKKSEVLRTILAKIIKNRNYCFLVIYHNKKASSHHLDEDPGFGLQNQINKIYYRYFS
jgi:hypothetical protein